ncbi:cobyric acid synthase [Ottowia sp.]|uniref:cobyric acid synthase n=1 Tax=Ottowia sp. TaxID=1898956 RepID=UPI003A891F28
MTSTSHTARQPARCIMVLGTSSGAGKSWIATALCRYYARLGLKVVPFKAQNMSNNARIVAPTLPAAHGALPPEGALAALGRPGGGSVAPMLPAAQGALPQFGQGHPGVPEEGVASPCGGAEVFWGEIGSAQYFQALAARAVPDVRMNPLLLKPEADTHSQVVLLGQVSRDLTGMPWRGRSERVWPQIATALDALRAENDVVVIEGAGSPAEINLMASDVVNLRVARHADARCLLVADIDRGGAFAHLYGTWALLPEDDRARIRGFVLNKFRGDAALLAPGPEQLQALTGVPTVAVVSMHFGHGLPEEDGVFDDRAHISTGGTSGAVRTRIAVVAYPRISNLDEFQPLKNVPGVHLSWTRSPAELADLSAADWIILPGSKATAADLAWLRAQGLDAAIAQHAARGGRVLGICGGLQMLGEALIDVHGVEPAGHQPAAEPLSRRGAAPLSGAAGNLTPAWGSAPRAAAQRGGDQPAAGPLPRRGAAPSGGSAAGAAAQRGGLYTNAPGLGLLPLVTSFEPNKTVCPARARFGTLHGAWAALSGVPVHGYEIHSGQTAQHPAMAAKGDVAHEVIPGLVWQNPAGNVLGLYLHGLFESPAVLHALFGADAPSLDDVFDRLADALDQAFEPGVLGALAAL